MPEAETTMTGRPRRFPAQYNSNANSFEAFTKGMNRKASAGMLMSYENFSNDFSTATYSSARSATLEERRGYRVQQDILIRKFLAVLWAECTNALYWFAPHMADGHAFTVEAGRASVPVRWQTPKVMSMRGGAVLRMLSDSRCNTGIW